MADTKLAVPPYGTECMSCGCNVYKPAPRLCRNASAHEIAGLAAPPVAEEATVTCPNSSLELKRCPKCEGKNVYVTCLDPGDVLPPYWVECDDCGIRTSAYRRDDTAANNWNQRTTSSPTREAEVELPPRPTAINATIEEATRYIKESVYLQFAMDPYMAALEARIAQLENR